jgi:hypothetical protein
MSNGQNADTARNIGQREGQSGGPSSPQQPGESSEHKQQRDNWYDWTKKQK